MSLYKYTYV